MNSDGGSRAVAVADLKAGQRAESVRGKYWKRVGEAEGRRESSVDAGTTNCAKLRFGLVDSLGRHEWTTLEAGNESVARSRGPIRFTIWKARKSVGTGTEVLYCEAGPLKLHNPTKYESTTQIQIPIAIAIPWSVCCHSTTVTVSRYCSDSIILNLRPLARATRFTFASVVYVTLHHN